MTATHTGFAEGTVEVVSYADHPLGPPDPGGTELLYTLTEFHYTGGMEGTGYHAYLQRLTPDSGPFRVMARVVGSLGGRPGTFVTEGAGTRLPTGPVDVDWRIVEGTGTGELVGVTGTGTVTTTEEGVVRYTLSYAFPGG
ncbi:DUF3224 domain-containing protein [Actinophytocola xanthii]|uniref:DUF3224 domain-containing protein n=1 Tax=Actinophytocola xanthii TaxID=1912961 RepID=UPI00130110F9|nr:DUF3224 domain-containing protein [Actinophytocola xanthii]